jgi:hypothetical protein
LLTLFNLLFILSEILPVILYACFTRRNKHEGLQVIFIYCLLSLSTEYLFIILRHRIDKFYLFASFTIIEYTLVSAFLYSSIKGRLKYIPAAGSLIFYAMVIINFLTKKSEIFDSLSASVESILLIIYIIIYLYGQIKDPSVMFVYQTKKFWIVIAFFIYFSSTLFLFIYAATFTNQEHKSYWYINNIFDIIKNILFCIAFSMKKSKNTRYPIENLYADI